MPKQKYSNELKAQVLSDYAANPDAHSVAKKYGIEAKQVW